MKKRLFIVSNYLTLLFSLAAIKMSGVESENHLRLVANFCKQKYFDDMKLFSADYNAFSSVSVLDDYENRQTHEIDISKYISDIGVDIFEEIYATCYYEQGIKFMKFFENADLFFLSNGLASYFPQKDEPEFYKRFKGFYYLNYFDKMIPFLVSENFIKGIPVDREFFINAFKNIADKIDLNPVNERSVVLCVQNLFFNNKNITPQQEYGEYKRIAEYFLSQGFVVYLKDHPRTPNVFNIYMQHPRVIPLKDYDTYPVESVIMKLKPTFVVSLFSTSLFNAKDLFGIDGCSFELVYPLEGLHLCGHVMTKSYFKSLGASTNHLVKIDSLYNQVLYEVLMFAFAKKHCSRERFENLQSNLKNVFLDDFAFLKLKKEFLEMLKYKSYEQYLKWQN